MSLWRHVAPMLLFYAFKYLSQHTQTMCRERAAIHYSFCKLVILTIKCFPLMHSLRPLVSVLSGHSGCSCSCEPSLCSLKGPLIFVASLWVHFDSLSTNQTAREAIVIYTAYTIVILFQLFYAVDSVTYMYILQNYFCLNSFKIWKLTY